MQVIISKLVLVLSIPINIIIFVESSDGDLYLIYAYYVDDKILASCNQELGIVQLNIPCHSVRTTYFIF